MVKPILLRSQQVNKPIELTPIGIVHSPYKEKFAIPRQPNLVPAAKATIELPFKQCAKESVQDIEQFSHLWLIFCFHGTQHQGWKPLVRPPRLGGNSKTGVLATRSTFRPNPIGMSVVALNNVEYSNQATLLHVGGVDLLDKTPILDIKPYLPYVDSIVDAKAGFAQLAPANNSQVHFTKTAQHQLNKQPKALNLTELISQVLAQDPRPAYKKHKTDNKVYGMHLHHVNVLWQVTAINEITVLTIEEITA